MKLLLIAVIALAAVSCTFTRCETWTIDPHALNPAAPSKPAGASCSTTAVP